VPVLGASNRMEVYMSLMHLLHFVTKQPTVRKMAIAGKHTILGFPLPPYNFMPAKNLFILTGE
jgi:hypothetical protein